MHGLMVDVLADGKALLYARARHYDLKHGRWLQRDPLGFIDGPNLYEAFGGNALVNLDPMGEQISGSMINGYPADEWIEMHRRSSTFGHALGDLKKAVIGLFINTEGQTERQYTEKFKDEVRHTAEGALVLHASRNPHVAWLLPQTAPQLASALTPRAYWELNGLGPAQGIANDAEGVCNIAIGLANLAIAAERQKNPTLLLLTPDGLAIPEVGFARDVFLRESDWVHNVSTRLGGEATIILVTVGLGEVLTPTRAIASPANAGRSLTVWDPADGTNAIRWVEESAGMSADAAAYNAGATGARTNLISRLPEVPQIGYSRLDGSLQLVRFDGLEGATLIDRKLAIVTTLKTHGQALQQSTALMEHGLTGCWEVPTAAEAARAQSVLDLLGIKNIIVRVVPR
jgi:RHS repeat-associated protein